MRELLGVASAVQGVGAGREIREGRERGEKKVGEDDAKPKRRT